MDKQHPRDVLAQNLTALMEYKKLTAPALQNKSGVGRSTINNIRNSKFNATSETIHGLAEAFRLPPWALYVPNLDVTVSYNEMNALISYYLASSADGRRAVIRFARSEADQAQAKD